ncbi:MAG: protein translocase subunit SecD [Fidelibacterota bacterium]
MNRSLVPRFILIVFSLVLAIYFIYPTIKYELMSDDKIIQLSAEGKLFDLESKILKRGLDLQGGMHVVLEVNVARLVENLATNKNEKFYEILKKSEMESQTKEEDFFKVFQREINANNINLVRYYSNRGIKNSEIISSLEKEAEDAIDRALEIIRNRVDQFGVSEPTIQKQGTRRIIVELAGIQDPQRARALLKSTAQLEFKLLKDPEITQAVLNRIDEFLKRRKAGITGEEKLAPAEVDTGEMEEPGESKDRAVRLEELFGELAPEKLDTGEVDSTVLVDEQIFSDRPFSALLRDVRGDIGVPVKNISAVKSILSDPEVKKIIPTDSQFLWSNEPLDLRGYNLPSDKYWILYFLERDPSLTGRVITDAKATFGGGAAATAGQPLVFLNMNSQGAKIWARVTGANVGKRVAIILDDKVHSAPVIRSKIPDGNTQIEGMANIQEARDLAIILRAGALPAPVEIIEERTVGPSLGSDSIRKGTWAALAGFLMVIVFMVIYYKFSGILADFALFLNLLFVLSILSALRATLTLPGIAGIILTVGMAVDANVLIFERIREELRKGKTIRSAIDSGYSKALRTIIDANVTTIAAALILFQFGTGPVKGFAVTLFWGILASMFTAIFVTRTIFHFITDRFTIEKLSI